MTSRGHDAGEAGHTLVELLLAMSMLIVILSATLLSFERFDRGNRDTILRTEANDTARRHLGLVTRQLRNLASPTAKQPDAIDQAEPDDLVFKTVDPNPPSGGFSTNANKTNVRRVRYCLAADGSQGAQRLWKAEQTWTTPDPPATYPATGTCPGAWANPQVVSDHVVNGSRALFTYGPAGAALSGITTLGMTLWVDIEPAGGPRETRIRTGVFLRNQNRAPIARFTAAATGNGRVVLNGSISEDPEGDPLTYTWFTEIPDVPEKIGTGITCDCPGLGTVEKLPAGTYPMWLVVSDSGNLQGVSERQMVEVLG